MSGDAGGSRPEIRARTIAIGVCLAVATLVVYAQVGWFDFVRYDDPTYVTSNAWVRNGLTADGFRWVWTATHGSNWHPLTWLSHMVDQEIFGGWAGGHHLTSVLFHVLNTLILFATLRSATGDEWPSALVAALFALHPLHVESVAWVSERKDVLSALFGLCAIASWIAYARRGGRARYALTLALFACGLAAKPMLVTLPFVLLLLDVWPLDRLRSRPSRATVGGVGALLLEKLPMLALSAASCAITLVAQERVVASDEAVPFSLRLANAAVSYVRYLGKTLWPVDLSVLYPHPYQPGGTPWATWQIWGAVVLLAALTAAAVRSRRRYLQFGWAWYLGTLVPVIGLVQVGQQAMADRYTYLPLIGLFVIVAWGSAEVARRFRGSIHVATVAALFALAAHVGLARHQTGRWADSISLFTHSLAVAPDPPALHNNLANALAAEGRYQEAMRHYGIALRIFPDYARAHNNLGSALARQGRLDEAIEHFRRAAELDPGYESAVDNLNRARDLRRRGP